jgi:hypothetical protein
MIDALFCGIKVQPLSTLPWGDYHDLKAPATDVVSITILYQGIEVRYITT